MKKTPPFFFTAVFTMLFLGIFYFTVTLMGGLYIASDLGGSHEISVYSLVFYGIGNCLSIPLSKYLIDRFGPYPVVIGSLLLYMFFSLLCAAASTFFLFNVLRFGLGFGAGPFYILANRLISEYCPLEKKGLYQTISMLFYSITPVVGASFGAWLAYENHWRWIFHWNQPISLLLLLYFWLVFPVLEPIPTQKKPFDGIGFSALCLSVVPLVTALTMGQELDWMRSPLFVFLLILGIPSLIFFVIWEIFHPYPILELRLMRHLTFSFSLFNLAVLFSAYFGMIILIALWLNIYVNYTPLWISVILGTMGFAGLIGFFLSIHWMNHIDSRIPLGFAILFFFLSCTYSSHFNVEIDFFRIAVARFLAGFGLVLFLIPLFHLCLRAYPKKEQATSAFTLFQTVRALSSSLGAGLYVILWQRRQVFFHERLGEQLTSSSPITKNYFEQATALFHLTADQANEMLEVLLEKQATSLGLNDAFGFMAVLLGGLFFLLVASFFFKSLHQGIRSTIDLPKPSEED